VLCDIARRLARRTPLLGSDFYFMLACYSYAAFVMNLSEHGEDMRFRLSVEPLIWVISVYAYTKLVSLFFGKRVEAKSR